MDRRLYKKKLDHLEPQIVEAYEKGMVLEEIAKLHNCAPNTVRNFLVSKGVTMRRKGRKSGTKNPVKTVEVTPEVKEENHGYIK